MNTLLLAYIANFASRFTEFVIFCLLFHSCALVQAQDINPSEPELTECQHVRSVCIFVSPHGSEGAEGTKQRPLSSVVKGVRLAEKRVTASPGSISVVYIFFANGTYFLEESVTLDLRVGMPLHGVRVFLKAEVSGGALLSGGSLAVVRDLAREGFVQLSLPVPTSHFFLNDHLMRQFHLPKSGSLKIVRWLPRLAGEVEACSKFGGFDSVKTGFVIPRPSWWAAGGFCVDEQAYVSLEREFSYEWLPVRILSAVRPEEAIVVPITDLGRKALTRSYPRRWVGQNIKVYPHGKLGDLGFADYKYDSELKHATFRNAECLENCAAIAPRLERLFTILGGGELGSLTFSGLVFAHTSYLPSIEGHASWQANSSLLLDGGGGRPFPGAIHLDGASGVNVVDSIFHSLGGHAIVSVGRSSNIVFAGNTVRDSMGGGVYLASDVEHSSNIRSFVSNVVVENNRFLNLGILIPDSVGVFVGFGSDVSVRHNLFSNLPYSAISIGWGWTDQSKGMARNLVAFNVLRNVLNRLSDGGGIYMLSPQPGSLVTGNCIELRPVEVDLPFEFGVGVYLDRGVFGVVASDNRVSLPERGPHARYLSVFDQAGNTGNTFFRNSLVSQCL